MRPASCPSDRLVAPSEVVAEPEPEPADDHDEHQSLHEGTADAIDRHRRDEEEQSQREKRHDQLAGVLFLVGDHGISLPHPRSQNALDRHLSRRTAEDPLPLLWWQSHKAHGDDPYASQHEPPRIRDNEHDGNPDRRDEQ